MISKKGFVLDALKTLTSLLSIFTSRRKLSDLFKRRYSGTEIVEKNQSCFKTQFQKDLGMFSDDLSHSR